MGDTIGARGLDRASVLWYAPNNDGSSHKLDLEYTYQKTLCGLDSDFDAWQVYYKVNFCQDCLKMLILLELGE